MERKRKAEEQLHRSYSQLSAFAVAKARLQPRVKTADSDENDSPSDDESIHSNADVSRASTPARRKSMNRPQHPNRRSQPPTKPRFIHHPTSEEADEVYTPQIEHDSLSDGTVRYPSGAPDHVFSTWTSSPANVMGSDKLGLYLRIDHGQRLACIGQYDLSVKKGSVTVYGATLHASAGVHRVFAPSTHAIPIIDVVTEVAELLLEHVDSRHGMRVLTQLSPLYNRIWNLRAVGVDVENRSFSILYRTADDPMKRPVVPLNLDPAWKEIVERVCSGPPSPVVMVGGPKASGKSTFCRVLANALLTVQRNNPSVPGFRSSSSRAVFYLDLDPGQSEYAPPGQLTLVLLRQPNLGPPFTHPSTGIASANRTIRAHTIAATTVRDNPKHFVDCALGLMDTYLRMRSEVEGDMPRPLVINCHGWHLGSGIDVVTALLHKLSGITDLVTMSLPRSSVVNYLAAVAKSVAVSMHPIPPAPKSGAGASSRSAAELREMQMISYFHSEELDGRLIWDAVPLTWWRPYVVRYGQDKEFLAFMRLGTTQKPEFLTIILNGTMVAITVIEDESATDGVSVLREQYYNLPYFSPDRKLGYSMPLDPRKCHTIGQALLRAIDTTNQTIHLLTPVSEALIANLEPKKTVLVSGALDVPAWAYLEDTRIEEHRERCRRKRASTRDEEYLALSEESAVPWIRKLDPNEGMGYQLSQWRARRFTQPLFPGPVMQARRPPPD